MDEETVKELTTSELFERLEEIENMHADAHFNLGRRATWCGIATMVAGLLTAVLLLYGQISDWVAVVVAGALLAVGPSATWYVTKSCQSRLVFIHASLDFYETERQRRVKLLG